MKGWPMKRSSATLATVFLCGVFAWPVLGFSEETSASTKPPAAEAALPPLGKPVSPAPNVPPVLDETALLAKLRSGVEADSMVAARKLAEVKTPAAFSALFDALSVGVSPKVAAVAIASLSAHLRPESLPVLELYAHHRNPELRKRALQGLSAFVLVPETAEPASAAAVKPDKKGQKVQKTQKTGAVPHEELAPRIVPHLIAALGDASSDVRGTAAESLGKRREKTAEGALIKLLLRKDSAAPPALGLIGGPETARALGEMIGTVPNYLLTQTLGGLLSRSDFGPEPARTEVVKMLGKMPGDQPVEFLTDYVKATDNDKELKARPSRAEAQKIIEQRTAK